MDQHYDEEIEVKHGRDLDSPIDFDVSNAVNFVRQDDLGRISDGDDYSNRSVDLPQRLGKMEERRPKSGIISKPGKEPESIHSDDSDSDSASEIHNKTPAENEFNPKLYENVEAPPDIKELFQFIARYTPQKIDIDYKLQPFIPDFIPAVGDIDAFLKVIPPTTLLTGDNKPITKFIEKLGLEILDEPSGQQSEPALLHMKLRSVTTSGSRTPGPPPSVAKSGRDIDRWISEIQLLHANQPAPHVMHSQVMPDIDALMAEWPPEMEQSLNGIGFPSASLDCELSFYIELVCSLLDIPIKSKTQSDYIVALYTLFNLFLSINKPVGL